jgi:glutamate synthase domain-containing protein 2
VIVRHSADFIEQLADASGLPVGIKLAVGDLGFWSELARSIESSGRAPDFITIDGREGGTGAAPLVFGSRGHAVQARLQLGVRAALISLCGRARRG